MRFTDSAHTEWLDLTRVAHVEASSEEETARIEHALSPTGTGGWRASRPGDQVVRIGFRQPTAVRRVRLVFTETRMERTQEFTLRWSSHRGETHGEIVRQQFNFSPAGATQEVEEYDVELPAVTWLELRIRPDVRGAGAVASVREIRVA